MPLSAGIFLLFPNDDDDDDDDDDGEKMATIHHGRI